MTPDPPSAAPIGVPRRATGPSPVPGRVDQLLPGLRRLTAPNPGLMTGPGTNTYLVGRDQLAVVDPGPDDRDHRRAILGAATAPGDIDVAGTGEVGGRDRGTIRWVLTTHTHPDHAPGARALARLTGAELVGFEARDGFVPDRAVGDGWVLEVPPFRVRAVHTPGHAGNHLCWLLEEPRLLLSGDHVMEGSTVVIRPPDGDMAAYLHSLDDLLRLDPPLAAIAPGHGRLIDDPATVVRGIVAHRLGREQRVVTALARAGRADLDQLLPVVYADVDPALLPVARNSLWAHLRKLEGEGRAGVEGGGPGAIDSIWTATPTT